MFSKARFPRKSILVLGVFVLAAAGACAGGVWKSSDGGTNWEPVFDNQTSQSIGSLAIAPSDSNQVWAGTGEAFICSNVLFVDEKTDASGLGPVIANF